jgi:Methylamine utilisation protein MauE
LLTPLQTADSPWLDPVAGYSIVCGIALLFALAGSNKLRNPAQFAEVFSAYRVLPEPFARRTAWFIPAMELAIALALPWEACRPWAPVAAIGFLIAYAAGISLNLARGRRELDCGCGAAGNRRSIAPWMVWRNLVLGLALAVAALPWSARPMTGLDLLTVIGALSAAAMLYAAVDRLLGDVVPKANALIGSRS